MPRKPSRSTITTPSGLIRQETGFDGRRTAYAYDLNGHLLEKFEFGADGQTVEARAVEAGEGFQLVQRVALFESFEIGRASCRERV